MLALAWVLFPIPASFLISSCPSFSPSVSFALLGLSFLSDCAPTLPLFPEFCLALRYEDPQLRVWNLLFDSSASLPEPVVPADGGIQGGCHINGVHC